MSTSVSEWYYILEGQEQGPLSEEDLKHVFECGALPLTTPVWRDGMEEWVQAKDCGVLIRAPLPNDALPHPSLTKPQTQDAEALKKRGSLVSGKTVLVSLVLIATSLIGWRLIDRRVLRNDGNATINDRRGSYLNQSFDQVTTTLLGQGFSKRGGRLKDAVCFLPNTQSVPVVFVADDGDRISSITFLISFALIEIDTPSLEKQKKVLLNAASMVARSVAALFQDEESLADWYIDTLLEGRKAVYDAGRATFEATKDVHGARLQFKLLKDRSIELEVRPI